MRLRSAYSVKGETSNIGMNSDEELTREDTHSNEDEIEIGIPSIKFRKDEEITFQVKRKPVTKKQKAHHTITLAYSSKKLEFPDFLTVEWVFQAVMEQQKTKKWLENSLRWFIEHTEYSSIFQIVSQFPSGSG